MRTQIVTLALGSAATAMYYMVGNLNTSNVEEQINSLNMAIGDNYLLNTTLRSIGDIAVKEAWRIWDDRVLEDYHISIIETYARSIWLGIRELYPTYEELNKVLGVGPAHFDYVFIIRQES